jgi:MoaA/NifB/PqqE/SkfB family radical SAM enzyme
MEVLYQPIEQNYNTPEDPRWFDHAPTWPRDIARAETTVRELIRMKEDGYPIANSMAQLEVMLPYFRNPADLRLSVQSHAAPGRPMMCAATTNLEVRANGDVRPCTGAPPVGNVKTQSIRDIWRERPAWWRSGCCLERQVVPLKRAASAGG